LKRLAMPTIDLSDDELAAVTANATTRADQLNADRADPKLGLLSQADG
jgi:hypothetical protein